MTKLWTGHKQVSMKPMHKMFTVTLTFDLASCPLFATHVLVTIIICTLLFINPTMHDKVMGQQKQVSLKPMQNA